MDRTRVLGVLALGTLLLLAGCQAPGTPERPEFSPTVTVVNATGAEQGTTIAVANNETLDPGLVFAQVRSLLDADVPPPTNVRVLDDLDAMAGGTPLGGESPVRRHLNVTMRGDLDLGDQENGAVNQLGGITIYPGEARDPMATTWVLAHELTHYVQVRAGHAGTVRERVDLGTTDGQFTYRAMLEGPAVFSTEAYLDEYAPGDETTLSLYRRIDDGLPDGSYGKYANRQYLLGYEYTRSLVDSPAELAGLYDRSARTSEQVIHGYRPAEAPMAALTVTYEGGDGWAETGRDRMGEAFLWAALEDRLGTDRARTAAAGWGNDSLLMVYPTTEGNASFAWVHRWDDEANASTFAAAGETYLDRAGTAAGPVTRLDAGATARLERLDERTTLLLVGERAFVTGTTGEAVGSRVRLVTTG